MGLFLAVSGVIGASAPAVQAALGEFAEARSGGFELAEGTTEDRNVGIISEDGAHTTVLYPNGFCEWDDVSQHISCKLCKPVFSFHIHDGDFWMYVLFDKGDKVDCFNPQPEYWGKVPAEERREWKGDAELVARVVGGITTESISGYLVEWDLEKEERVKAYPDDEFPVGNCWQMCDFLRTIGMRYPMSGDEEALGSTFKLWTEAFPLATPSPRLSPAQMRQRKPWWRFW